MKFDYVVRDSKVLVGKVFVTIAINRGDVGKKACGITFPYRFFPVLNILMAAIIRRLNSWKRLPDGWEGRNISIIGLVNGKYAGFRHLGKLIRGAELWTKI